MVVSSLKAFSAMAWLTRGQEYAKYDLQAVKLSTKKKMDAFCSGW